jgi:hypothetical protein
VKLWPPRFVPVMMSGNGFPQHVSKKCLSVCLHARALQRVRPKLCILLQGAEPRELRYVGTYVQRVSTKYVWSSTGYGYGVCTLSGNGTFLYRDKMTTNLGALDVSRHDTDQGDAWQRGARTRVNLRSYRKYVRTSYNAYVRTVSSWGTRQDVMMLQPLVLVVSLLNDGWPRSNVHEVTKCSPTAQVTYWCSAYRKESRWKGK